MKWFSHIPTSSTLTFTSSTTYAQYQDVKNGQRGQKVTVKGYIIIIIILFFGGGEGITSLVSFVPRPHPKNWERGLGSLANFPVCAESACYSTITCLT